MNLKVFTQSPVKNKAQGTLDKPVPVAVIHAQRMDSERVDKPLRVAAYCRVSTVRDNQLASMENQRRHYEELIENECAWELVDVYCDLGLSGRRKDTRPELERMMDDCRYGRIDLILTKSISRFSRNAADCLELVRTLSETGTEILFEKENIHSGRMESEFLLGILAALAEEESRAISGNEMWAVERRFASGSFHYSKAPYGYRIREKALVIHEQEAAVVRRIFADVLAGKGTTMIAKELNAEQIPSSTRRRDGSPGVWSASRIQGMVANEVYTGNAVWQKTFHDGFRRRQNRGERPRYYVEGHHAAIINRTVFDRAQAANRQRGVEKNNRPEKEDRPHESKYGRRTCFSGMLFCGCCGSVLRRRTARGKSGPRHRWVCRRHLQDSAACAQKAVLEETIQNAFQTMLHRLYFSQDVILNGCIEEMQTERADRFQYERDQLRKRMRENADARSRLLAALRDSVLLNAETLPAKLKLQRLEMEAARQRKEWNALSEARMRTEEAWVFRRFVMDAWERPFSAEAFSEHVNKVVVYGGGAVVFHLKCGFVFAEPWEESC